MDSSFSSAESESQWSSLPPEILTTVAVRLHSHFSLLRLRSTCSSWRSSLPLTLSPLCSFPLTLPPLSDVVPPSSPSPLAVCPSTVLRISPFSSSSSCSPWLVKLSLSPNRNPNAFSLLNPLTTAKIKTFFPSPNNRINLLDFRIEEIADSFHLEYLSPEAAKMNSPVFVKKVVVLPDLTVLILSYGGKLRKWRPGDEGWTPVSGNRHGGKRGGYYDGFEDVICFRNEFYTVDVSGILVRYDIGFIPVEFTTSVGYSPGERKYLVAGRNDDLYMISKISDPDPELCYDYIEEEYVVDVDTIDMPLRMRVCKLDRKRGYWDYVRMEVDEVFFLGDYVSFMISAKDFDGCRADSIYLTDEYFWKDEDEDNVYGQDTGLYALDDRLVVRLAEFPKYAKLFWPPPSWVIDGSTSSVS